MNLCDTNIFNKLVDGFPTSDLPCGQLGTTHLQSDEVSRTRIDERRIELLLKLYEIAPASVPTESFVWGVSRWGQGKWGDGRLCEALLADLDALNNRKANNISDALLAETAIVNGFTLLTADYHLTKVARKHGAAVIYYPHRGFRRSGSRR
jgi:hypothetical protein